MLTTKIALKRNHLTVEAFIEKNYYSINSTASFKEVNEVFLECLQNDLPIVDDGIFQGIIYRSQVVGREDNKDEISSIHDHFKVISIQEDERLIIALKTVINNGIFSLPVIDEEGMMKGVLLAPNLWNEFSVESNLGGLGGWIVLSMNKNDFKLSEIAHIVESNGMIMVFHYVHFIQELNLIEVHLKVNKENVNELVQTFQRYSYKVVDVIQDKKFDDDWDSRFDELMRYFST